MTIGSKHENDLLILGKKLPRIYIFLTVRITKIWKGEWVVRSILHIWSGRTVFIIVELEIFNQYSAHDCFEEQGKEEEAAYPGTKGGGDGFPGLEFFIFFISNEDQK